MRTRGSPVKTMRAAKNAIGSAKQWRKVEERQEKAKGASPRKAVHKESALTSIGRGIGNATGTGAIARAALSAEQAMIDRLVAAARKAGVKESTIAKALAAKKRGDRVLAVAALLYPMIPNPALLRVLAGEPLESLDGSKKTGTKAPKFRKATSRR